MQRSQSRRLFFAAQTQFGFIVAKVTDWRKQFPERRGFALKIRGLGANLQFQTWKSFTIKLYEAETLKIIFLLLAEFLNSVKFKTSK